ncbi:hypothetical protein JCM10207_001677 [Rhodosporidiobolus poonsookiae]
MDAHPLPPLDVATSSVEESLNALSTQLVSHGYLSRPLDLQTLFLAPSLPSNPSSKALKKHHDTLILQARAREQLAKCLWGMLEKRNEEREVLEGLLAREARASGDAERERTLRERLGREREQMARDLEAERARAKEAEAKLKTEQERHRHSKDELAKTKSALQFVKTQALHDQKRREAETTALHQKLQKLTTSSDSAFTRFVVLNSSSSSPSASSPLNATFGGRTSRLSGSARSPTPTSASSSAAVAALEAEVDLLSSALDEATAARTHLDADNFQLREFVSDVGEWAEGVVEMEEFRAAMQQAGVDEGEELAEVLKAQEDADESYMVPTPHLSLPVSALVPALHRKLYAIRLGLSSLSTASSARVEALRVELEAELEELHAQVEEEQLAREAAQRGVEEMGVRAEEADRLVREFVEKQAETRRKTMQRGADSDDDSVPTPVAASLAASKAARLAAKLAKTAPPPLPTATIAPAASAAPRPSEPPSSSVAAFLSELGLDTPAVPAAPLVSQKAKTRAADKDRAAAKDKETRLDRVAQEQLGSVERQREKKVLAASLGVGAERRERPSIARPSIARAPSSAASTASSSSASSSSKPEQRRTSGSSRTTSSSRSVSAAPPSKPSSALSSILALADSPPAASDALLSTTAAAKKPLSASAVANAAASRTGDDADKSDLKTTGFQPSSTAPGVAGTAGQPPAGYEGGHFNQITQRWELPSDRVEIPADQSASTMPDADGTTNKPSFKEQVNGFAKKFAGKAFGKDHEVAMGDTLLAGQGRQQAERTAETVKQQQA